MALKKYLALLAVSAFVAVGCGSKEDDLSSGTSSGGGSSASSSSSAPAGKTGTASVSGKITLSGKGPIMQNIDFAADATCKSQHSTPFKDQTVEADAKGNLADVFVYVKEGADNYPAPSSPVVLTQKGCNYTPHVFGIQTKQTLQVVNDDPTLHNVHCMAAVNDQFNLAQPSQGTKSEKSFDKVEVPVHFKCDVHGWMHCMACVVNNPFFAISGTDGTFKISNLPAGSYTLVAVQEKYGESEPQKVEIKDGESKSLNFTFAAK